jgi:hypothetical protein
VAEHLASLECKPQSLQKKKKEKRKKYIKNKAQSHSASREGGRVVALVRVAGGAGDQEVVTQVLTEIT